MSQSPLFRNLPSFQKIKTRVHMKKRVLSCLSIRSLSVALFFIKPPLFIDVLENVYMFFSFLPYLDLYRLAAFWKFHPSPQKVFGAQSELFMYIFFQALNPVIIKDMPYKRDTFFFLNIVVFTCTGVLTDSHVRCIDLFRE